MAAKTPAVKKRKIVQDNRAFNEDWTTNGRVKAHVIAINID